MGENNSIDIVQSGRSRAEKTDPQGHLVDVQGDRHRFGLQDVPGRFPIYRAKFPGKNPGCAADIQNLCAPVASHTLNEGRQRLVMSVPDTAETGGVAMTVNEVDRCWIP